MNYDISNLATKPEDDMAFSEMESLGESYHEAAMFWWSQMDCKAGMKRWFAYKRRQWYWQQIQLDNDIPY